MRRLVVWSHGHRAIVLSCAAALVLLSAFGARGLTFDADVLRLLPREGQVFIAFRTFLDRFGSIDQLYIVFTAPEGYSVRDYDEQIATWIERLKEAHEIERVDAGTVDDSRKWSYIADHQLILLDGAALDRALARFQPGGMDSAVRESREMLSVPSPEIAGLVRQDPLGLLMLLRKHIGDDSSPGVAVSEAGYLSSDERQRLVIARPARPPYDTRFSHALLNRLGAIEAAVREEQKAADAARMDEEPQPPLVVEYAGGHRIAVETEAVVKRESIVNSVGSLAMILPLLFVVFRSPWLVAVGAVPSALSLLVVLGALGLTRATLSAAATGASAMLFGLGVDGVVLLYVAHRLGFAEGASADEAIAGLAGPSSSMLLGMWTTAATFYGLLVVDFPSLEQLGLLIGHSMVVCGVITLFIIPAMLPRQRRPATRQLTMPRLAAFVRRRSKLLLGAAVVVSIVLGLAATRVRVNPSLDRLRSVTPGSMLEARIAEAFGLAADVHVVLSQGYELERLLQANESIARRIRAELPDVQIHAPTSLVPSQAAQAARRARIQHELPSAAEMAATLKSVAARNGFHEGAFDPFVARLPVLRDSSSRVTFDGYVAAGLSDLVSRFISRGPDGWTLATYVFPRDAASLSALERIVAASGIEQQLTGLPLVNRALADRFVPQFLMGLAVGSALVVLLIVITFRDLKLALLSFIPTAVGLLWAAGLFGLAGMELDLFAVFAVLTFVGIGVDFGIHMVHRSQERGDAERACAELAPVILVAGAITLLGYGTLVASSYPPLRSIGLVSAVSVVALVASSLFVLPSLLSRGSR